MTSRSDFTDSVREDDRRKREEARIQALQTQLDEARNLSRELMSRQLRLEEQLKSGEAALAQHRLALEQHRHEVSQTAQARQLEEARVRQQLSELGSRIDDSTRPIRSLQAHVSELIETVRRRRDDDGHETKRFDEIHALIDHLAAHGERQVGVSQSLRESIDAVRSELERLQRDLIRTDDGVRIVEQELRRRFAEVVQVAENLGSRMDQELGGIGALQAQIDALREDASLIDPQFASLRDWSQRLESEIARFHAQALERDEITAERVEEVRQQFEGRLQDLAVIGDQRYERVNQRVDHLEEVDRELGYGIKLLEMHLEELRQMDRRLRRELWYLHEQRARLRFEQAQHEMESVIEARRDAERQDTGERSQDRRQE
ncbi:MAG TPA: hypothetical protein VMU89_21025 [Thermomicrobiaceae bacterium]|nr:hypothetical protein [Thermomicrobiaceae bacterium]